MSNMYHKIRSAFIPSRNNVEPVDDFKIRDSWVVYAEDTKENKDKALDYICYQLEVRDPETGERQVIYKAVKFLRVIRVPEWARQSTALMDMHAQVLSAAYETEVNITTVIANILKPKALGFMFLYGVQGTGTDIETAKAKADSDFNGLVGSLQGTYRVLEMRFLNVEETEWLREKMTDMKFMTAIRGIPKANKTGEDAGNKGFGGKNINPDSQGTIEEFVTAMVDYEYVVQIINSPVRIKTLETMQFRLQDKMTDWNSQLQGQTGLSANISIPIMYATNTGTNTGVSHNYTDSSNIGYGTNEGTSMNVGENFGQNVSHNFGETLGINKSFTEGVTHGISHNTGLSHGFGVSENTGISGGFSNSVNEGSSLNVGQNEGFNYGQGVNSGHSINTNQGVSENSSFTEGMSSNTSYGVSNGHSFGTNNSTGYNLSHGANISDGYGTNTNASYGVNMNANQTRGLSNGLNFNHSSGYNFGTSSGVSENLAGSWGYGENSGTSRGGSLGYGAGGNVGLFGSGGNSNMNVGNSIGISDGASANFGGSASIGGTSGVSAGFNATNSFGANTSESISNSMGMGTNASMSNGISTNHSIGRNISEGFNASTGTNESVNVGNSINQGYGTNMGYSTSQGSSSSIGQGFNEGTSANAGFSNGTSIGAAVNTGTGYSENVGFNKSIGTSENFSTNESWGESVSTSNSVSTGQSQSVNHGVSMGNSYGQSRGFGVNRGTNQTEGYSTATGLGQTAGITQGMSMSGGFGPSIGINKSHQWVNQSVKDLLEILEFKNNRLKRALNGRTGAFYTYVYVSVPTIQALDTAMMAAKSTWGNEATLANPLEVLNLSAKEQSHLLYHAAAFSVDITKEPLYDDMEYKYCSLLLPDELNAYTHLPRISEGGVFANVPDVPLFAVPGAMEGEIYIGTILNAERYTLKNGYMTPYDYRIPEDSLMHGLFVGASRSGKTVCAMRFIASLAQIKRKATGKKLRIVCLDPKNDWRGLAKWVDPERFRFFSLGNAYFHPLKLNVWKVPMGVNPQLWIDSVIDIYCRAYGLLERGKQMIADVVYELYKESGVFDTFQRVEGWETLIPELSAKVSFQAIFKRMEEKRDILCGGNKSGKDTMDAYARLLERLAAFDREYSVEHMLFGTSEGIGIDEMVGADDVTVIESQGLENTFKNFIFGAITNGFYLFGKQQEGGYLNENQYETVLVIEEANEVLTGNDSAVTGKSSDASLPGQSPFETMLDQAAGYGLFVMAITQKISQMPSSLIANVGLKFIGRINVRDDIDVAGTMIGKEMKFDDKAIIKWLPKSPTGWVICQVSRGNDFKTAEPVLVKVAMLDTPKPSNAELDEFLIHSELLKQKQSEAAASA